MKNKIHLDSDTMVAISDDLRGGMRPILNELKEKIQSENLDELSKWYVKMGGSRDEVLSVIANNVVEKMTECLPQNYVQFMIENISVDTLRQKPGITFDASYDLDPLKFYVEFLIRIGGQYITSGRVRFEINTNGTFKELKLQQQRGETKKFRLGKLEANIGISLVGLPFVNSIEPHEIVKKQFVVDFSKYCIG